MQVCLDEVCAYTGWPVGHVYRLEEEGSDTLAPLKIWHLDNPQRFATFRRVTEEIRFAPGVGLPGRVLSSGDPTWIVDVTKDPNFPRARLAEDIGVKAGFAFPVLVGRSVAAVMEFFSTEAIEPDQHILEIMAQVGTQLGRVLERTQAEESPMKWYVLKIYAAEYKVMRSRCARNHQRRSQAFAVQLLKAAVSALMRGFNLSERR